MIKVSIQSHSGVKRFSCVIASRAKQTPQPGDCHVADAPRNDNSGAGASLCSQ